MKSAVSAANRNQARRTSDNRRNHACRVLYLLCGGEGGRLLRGDAPDRSEGAAALIRVPPPQDLPGGRSHNSQTALERSGQQDMRQRTGEAR